MAGIDFDALSPGPSTRATSAFPGAQEQRPRQRRTIEFTVSASWKCPDNVHEAFMYFQAPGGGGGGCDDGGANVEGAGGGGAGELMYGRVPLVPGTIYTLTLAAAGVGGVALASGGTVGDSTFVGAGLYLLVKGGKGGAPGGTRTGGAAAGTTAAANVLLVARIQGPAGGNGGNGGNGADGSPFEWVPAALGGVGFTGGGGGGGSSLWGPGGAGGVSANGANASGQGAGGGGAGFDSGSDRNGGNGGAGFLRLIYDE